MSSVTFHYPYSQKTQVGTFVKSCTKLIPHLITILETMTTDLAFTISGEIKDLKDKAFSRIKTSAKLHKYSHVCSLPPSEDMVVAFINSGHCVYLRRMLRKYSAINNNSKYASDCFKSSKQIEKEMKRHFKHYYCMIHPFSLFT